MLSSKNEPLPTGFVVGNPLPHVLRGDISALSADAKKKLAAATGPRPGIFVATAALNWCLIATVIWLANRIDHWMFYIFAVIFIAGRQQIFGILLHEQTHYLAFKSRTADIFTNIFVGWPIFVSVENYGSIHLSHHQHFLSLKDPDYMRKNGPDWSFPMEWKHLLWLFMKDLSGLNAIQSFSSKNNTAQVAVKRRAPLPAWWRRAFYVMVIAVLSLTGHWIDFLILWMIPLLTVVQAFVRIGAINEHRYNLIDPSIADSTPIVRQSFLASVFFPNLNFGYHIYHHMHTGISWSQLPKVHRIFVSEGLVNHDHIFKSQWSFVRYLQKKTLKDQAPSADRASA